MRACTCVTHKETVIDLRSDLDQIDPGDICVVGCAWPLMYLDECTGWRGVEGLCCTHCNQPLTSPA